MDTNQISIDIEDNSISGSENTYGRPGFQDLEGKYWAGYSCNGDSDNPDLSQCIGIGF